MGMTRAEWRESGFTKFVVGIDPGSITVGMALIGWPGCEYVTSTDIPVAVHMTGPQKMLDAFDEVLQKWLTPPGEGYPVYPMGLAAIEKTVSPSAALGMINPTSVINTAYVEGLLSGFVNEWCEYHVPLVRVAPAGFGASWYCSYPPELVSDSERRIKGWRTRHAGRGRLCHQRSAYDVAVIAARTNRKQLT